MSDSHPVRRRTVISAMPGIPVAAVLGVSACSAPPDPVDKTPIVAEALKFLGAI